jgi:hypothetical protein
MAERDSKQARRESVERQLADSDPGNPGQTASPARENPVRDDEITGTEPDSPHGVGESVTTRAEDQPRNERDRPDRGTKGPTERPVGTSTARDQTGVDPQEPAVPKGG